jgi:hypothetical protein
LFDLRKVPVVSDAGSAIDQGAEGSGVRQVQGGRDGVDGRAVGGGYGDGIRLGKRGRARRLVGLPSAEIAVFEVAVGPSGQPGGEKNADESEPDAERLAAENGHGVLESVWATNDAYFAKSDYIKDITN